MGRAALPPAARRRPREGPRDARGYGRRRWPVPARRGHPRANSAGGPGREQARPAESLSRSSWTRSRHSPFDPAAKALAVLVTRTVAAPARLAVTRQRALHGLRDPGVERHALRGRG